MKDASAIRANAAMGLGPGNLGSEEGIRRDESRRMSEGRTWVSLLEHTTGGGILDIGVGCCGELPHDLSFWLSSKAISIGRIPPHS